MAHEKEPALAQTVPSPGKAQPLQLDMYTCGSEPLQCMAVMSLNLLQTL